MIYYLYIKTHKTTGLKYLGQTQRDPYFYNGSGKYWKRHLKKHGTDITTEIIGAFDRLIDLKYAGKFWSQKFKIIQSSEWANLKIEDGTGGLQTDQTYKRGVEKRKREGTYISWNTGLTIENDSRLIEIGKRISKAKKGKDIWKNLKITCVKCNYTGRPGVIKRWHNENCGKGDVRQLLHCNHCKKDVDYANYARWHGENCKFYQMSERAKQQLL